MAKESKELSTKVDEQMLAELKASYPVEATFNRILLPRLGLVSQDVTEGKGKSMKVVTEAGTFYIETQTEELDENGKKKWERTEIGTELDAIILFERKQLRFYDSSTETYTSSPIYDTDDQVIPLFKDKAEIDRGTPAELRSRAQYQGVSAKGKPMSKLEENRILYVLVDDTVYQLNLRGTSMYAFMTYKRTVVPNTVVTHLSSDAQANGSIAWNQMAFEVNRPITAAEARIVIGHINEIKGSIEAEKQFYAGQNATPVAAKNDDDF